MHRVVAEAKKEAGIPDYTTLKEAMQNTDMSLRVGKLVLDEWTKEREASKEKKLKHYAGKDLKRFFQIDVSSLGVGSDDADEDGHEISWGFTEELMNGAHVRVLIAPGQDSKDVKAMLQKVVGRAPSFEAKADSEEPIPF